VATLYFAVKIFTSQLTAHIGLLKEGGSNPIFDLRFSFFRIL